MNRRTLPQLPADIRQLLRDLHQAIWLEVLQAGDDEVTQHPVLRHKQQLLARADKVFHKYGVIEEGRTGQ
jgi:hypothetical protein